MRRAFQSALVGAAAGGSLGYLVEQSLGGEETARLAGGWMGLTLGAPLGAHLANERRGSYPLAALASAGVGVGGTALIVGGSRMLLDGGSPGTSGGELVNTILGSAFYAVVIAAAGFATALGQIKASTAVERATAR